MARLVPPGLCLFPAALPRLEFFRPAPASPFKGRNAWNNFTPPPSCACVAATASHWRRWPGHPGNIVIKGTARKIRRLYHDKILAGFAGATADAFTLQERFEAKLEKHQGNLMRAAVELTRDWRTTACCAAWKPC